MELTPIEPNFTPKKVDFNHIDEPGTYVFVETGNLLRIGAEALVKGHSPLLTITSRRGNACVRIWPDDSIPIDKARHVAANFGLPVGF